ncbi:MAG: hypothetical protein U0263_07130 [Polyangiaceae bacterium]
MSEVDRLIRARIDQFVDELTELVRRAALEAVSEALGGRATRPAEGTPARTRRRRVEARGSKRTASDLGALTERIERHVQDNPGEGAQHIARALGVGTKDLVLPLKKLLESGAVHKKGERRATKYYRGKK